MKFYRFYFKVYFIYKNHGVLDVVIFSEETVCNDALVKVALSMIKDAEEYSGQIINCEDIYYYEEERTSTANFSLKFKTDKRRKSYVEKFSTM